MAPKNIDYSKTIIYKICCKDVNIKDIYIGSTTDFIRRRGEHERNTTNINSKSYNYYKYDFIRNNGGFENWEMVEIERYNAVDSNDALKRERYWLEILGATLNKNIPTRTLKEYYNDNREKFKEYYEVNKENILEYGKEYFETNKDKLKEKAKEYYNNNQEKLLDKHKEWIEANPEYYKEYKEANQEKIKEYYEVNKENILEKAKEYYKTNKNTILEKQKEKIICVCGSVCRKSAISVHNKTKKHINYIESNDPNNYDE